MVGRGARRLVRIANIAVVLGGVVCRVVTQTHGALRRTEGPSNVARPRDNSQYGTKQTDPKERRSWRLTPVRGANSAAGSRRGEWSWHTYTCIGQCPCGAGSVLLRVWFSWGVSRRLRWLRRLIPRPAVGQRADRHREA